MSRRRWPCFAVLLALLTPGGLSAGTAVTVGMDWAHPGVPISDEFAGLSFETALLLPDESGSRYFRPQNRPLIDLFRTLGIANLRIGGNTADKSSVGIPGKADIDSLFGFAEAAGVKVIYTVRLKQGDVAADARIVQYLVERHRKDLAGVAIGNEPNFYFKDYAAYRDEWKRFAEVIAAVPGVRLDGPSVGPTEWLRRFPDDFGNFRPLKFVSAHVYFGGAGDEVTDPAEARNRMLSPGFVARYERFYRAFAPAAAAHGLPYRLEEVNNFYNGGARRVSDTFASALWALDLMHWWAAHGASGINLHSGDRVAAGQEITECKYAAFVSEPGGYLARPMAYGIKAFDLGGHGRVVPLTLGNAARINLTAYAVAGNDGRRYVTLINKEPGPAGREATVRLEGQFGAGETVVLSNPSGDVAASAGQSLGGAEIRGDGGWAGSWSALPSPGRDGRIIIVPAATAMVVRFGP